MRKPALMSLSIALVAGLTLTAFVGSPASALTTGVAFSGDELPTWQTNGVVYGVSAAKGKVIAGGTFSQIRPPVGGVGTARTQNALAVLNAETGEPDSCQFPVTLSGGTPTVRAVVTSPDQSTIYVGGNFTSIGGVAVTRIAALDPVACTVKSFRVSSISSFVFGLVATPSTVYIAGQFTSVAGQPRQRFAAVDAVSGALLPFAPDADAIGRAVAVSPDGTKVAVGGDFFTVNGQNSHSLAVVDAATGQNIRNYPTGFFPSTSITKTLWSAGSSFYGGNEGSGGGVFDGRFAIDWDSLDERWRDACLGATQAVYEHRGTLYSASHAHDCESNNAFQDGTRKYFMAQNTSDAQLLGWYPTANDGTGEGIGPRALTVAQGASTGKDYLWYGGEFTVVNGKSQQGLTRFGPDDVTVPPTPVAVAEAITPLENQIRFRTVVDPDDDVLTYRVYRNNVTTPIWTGTATSQWWTRPQVTVVDPNVVAGVNYSYRVTASDGVNTSAQSPTVYARAVDKAVDYPTQVIRDDAELYWRLNEVSGTWAQDRSGATTAGRNGLYKNGVVLGVSGALEGDASAQFDGTGGYLWNDQQRPGPTTYSIETWIKTTTTRGGKIAGFGSGRPFTNTGGTRLSGNYDRHIYMDNGGRLTFGVFSGGTQTIRSASAYNDDQWHHIVATQGSDGMKLYVDGVRVGQNPTVGSQAYAGNWHVGGDNLGGWPNQPASAFFAGQIDEFAVYPSVLSARQAANHFNLGGGDIVVPEAPSDAYGARIFDDGADLFWRLDEASGEVAADSSFIGQSAGTYSAGTAKSQEAAIRSGSGVRLSGSSDGFISTQQAISSPSAYSLETWVKSSTTSGGKVIGFENSTSGPGSNYDKQIYMTNRGSFVFGVYTGQVNTIETTSTYNDGKWHHVVATQGSQGMALYLDGQVVGTNSVTDNQAFEGYWRVGGGNLNSWPSQPASQFLDGNVDEVAVYGKSLSASEVAAHRVLGISTAPETTAPSAPVDVAAQVESDSVTVTWSASSDDTAVTGYSVHRSASLPFTADLTNKIADVSIPGYTDLGLATGTYHYVIVAHDAAGNTSASSSAASASIVPPPDTVAPSVPARVSASVAGSDIAVSWDASTDAVGVVGYSLFRGTTPDFAATVKVADVISTSATDRGLAPGTYYYFVTAIDAAGNVSSPASSAAATVAAPPAQPVVITVSPTEDAMVFASNPTTNYGVNTQLSSRGGTGTSPIASYAKFDLPTAPAGTTLTNAQLRVRTSTDGTAASPDAHAIRIVTGSWSEGNVTWNNRPSGPGAQLGSLVGATATNTTYTVALNAQALNGLTGTSASLELTGGGTDNLRLWSANSTTPSYRPALTLTYTPGASPVVDTTAPTSPTGVSATVVDATATISWSPSTDVVGVTGYTLHRGADANFTVTSANQVGSTAATSASDPGLAPGTYYYRIVAFDAAGNVSTASAAVLATVASPPPAPVVISAEPLEDAMVFAQLPTNNYGVNTQLSARGGTGASPVSSYFKFALPAAPEGTTLTGATLRVRTSTDATAASIDPQEVTIVTGEWSESTVTWNVRPMGTGPRLATLTGLSALNTPNTTDVNVSALQALLGSTVSVALTGTGGDNLRLWSKDSVTATYRPLLTLTYSPN